jgi:hypothetical protein
VFVSIRDIDFCNPVADGSLNKTLQICAGTTIASNGFVKDSCQVKLFVVTSFYFHIKK